MKWALVDSNGIIKNLIMWDGVSPYSPPPGLSVQQVNDWVDLEDHKDVQLPPEIVPDPVQEKVQRNKAGVLNLGIIGSFVLYKQNNPTAKFSDFMDMLESTQQAMLNALNG